MLRQEKGDDKRYIKPNASDKRKNKCIRQNRHTLKRMSVSVLVFIFLFSGMFLPGLKTMLFFGRAL